MDNSKEYIAMCKNAKEILTYKYKIGFNEGDYVYDGFHVRIVGHDFINFDEASKEGNYNIFRFAVMKKPEGPLTISPSPSNSIDLIHGEYVTEWIENPIWIPTQDQLQDLSSAFGIPGLLYEFNNFIFDNIEDVDISSRYSVMFKSMEQLWMAFIMQEEYGKQWNGKEWVEI